MPRKLPWMQGGSSAAGSLPNKPSSTVSRPPKKRVKVLEPESEHESDTMVSKPTKKLVPRGHARTPSTSPPPEAPPESFMEEGIDQDDKYRMVEDEFLSIAQQFTVHLHAAEYKRQQKMVKVRNAEAINSISRPVTGKMPNHTKRRVEGVAKAKAQRTVLQTLLGEKPGEEESSDDSDGDGLPYVGTTLHGLMDSPRGKSASLSKIRASNVATRAAAGFGKPVQRSSQISPSVSPASKVASRLSLPKVEYDGSTESSDDDDDDDLDAPVASRNLSSFNRKANLVPTAMDISRSAVTVIESSRSSTSTTQLSMENSSYSKVTTAVAPPKPVPTSSETARIDMESKARLARRLEIAKLRKAKQEQEEKKKPTAVIPTFL